MVALLVGLTLQPFEPALASDSATAPTVAQVTETTAPGTTETTTPKATEASFASQARQARSGILQAQRPEGE